MRSKLFLVLLLFSAAIAVRGEIAPTGSFDYDGRTWGYKLTDEGLIEITSVAPDGGVLKFPSEYEGVRVDVVSRSANLFSRQTFDSAIVPEGVTKIGGTCFYSTSIKSVRLPETLTAIGSHAFQGTYMDDVFIPKNVSEIEEGAFCATGVKRFQVDPENRHFTAIDGSLYMKDPQTLVCIRDGRRVEVASGTRAIGMMSFYYVKTVRLSIPCDVETFDSYALTAAAQLDLVEFREGVLSCSLATLKRRDEKYDWDQKDWVNIPVPMIKICSSVTDITSDMSGLKGVRYVLYDEGDGERVREMVARAGLPLENVTFIRDIGEDVPEAQAWADRIPGFGTRFWGDAGIAMTFPTGKIAADGRAMTVYDDYVAGTDPMDLSSRFTAKIEIVDGKPIVSYEPDLGAARRYTVYGSDDLKSWSPISEDPARFKFFKVTVEPAE